MIKLIIPFPPSVLRPNDKSHWRVKNPIKNRYKEQCHALALKNDKPLHNGLLNMEIHFTPPNNRWDWDGMISAAKAGFDGVAIAWKIDDKFFRPSRLYWNKADKEGAHIIIFAHPDAS